MEVDKIEFLHPFFQYIIGKSNTGKTFYINHIVDDAVKKRFKILYVVNKAFDVEEEILERMEKNKNIFVIKTGNLAQGTIDFLTKSMTSQDPKLIIVDNFTYGLTLPFLDFTTFSRKYNASVVFISHSMFSNKTISPRLRELVSYFVLFYLPDSDSLSKILDDKLKMVFDKEITFRSFKFLIIDQANSTYLVSKIPEYKPVVIYKKIQSKKKYDIKPTLINEI